MQTAPTDHARRALTSLEDWWALFGVEAPPAAPARPAASTALPPHASATARPAAPQADPDADGPALAASAGTLEALRAALERFSGCPLKSTAKNLVFSRGTGACGVMIVGEAPGREEDEQGAPFVGKSGRLLDAMFSAIGIARDDLYVTNIVNWRPPGNRKPSDAEIEACRPFIERHVALVKPKVIVLAGGVSAATLLRTPDGIMSLRGRWRIYERDGISVPALPVFHPAFLLRRPAEKAKAWLDMLEVKAKLKTL